MKTNLSKKKEKEFDLIIFDAMNTIHRFFWTMRELSDSKGRKTGMIYGIVNHLHHLKKDYPGTKIIFAWDTPADNKKKIDPEYKSTRKKNTMPEFWNQVKEIQAILCFYGITQLYSNGYEADDIIAKLVLENENKKILIVSNDSDIKSLLQYPHVKMMFGKKIWNKEDYFEEYAIEPEFIQMIKIVSGDIGDNVKGIPRINQKKLYQLCALCSGSVDLLKGLDSKIDFELEKTFNKIIENWNIIEKNKKMIALQTKCNYEEIEPNKDIKRLIAILDDYEMESLIKKIKEETINKK